MESTGSDTAHHLRSPGAGSDEGRNSSPYPSATSRPERNSIVPPFWNRDQRTAEDRNSNNKNGAASAETIVVRPPPIQLEDHTDETSEQCKALWAKGVTIDDYVVVSGTAPGVGSYVVWNCTVETLDVSAVVYPSHVR